LTIFAKKKKISHKNIQKLKTREKKMYLRGVSSSEEILLLPFAVLRAMIFGFLDRGQGKLIGLKRTYQLFNLYGI